MSKFDKMFDKEENDDLREIFVSDDEILETYLRRAEDRLDELKLQFRKPRDGAGDWLDKLLEMSSLIELELERAKLVLERM